MTAFHLKVSLSRRVVFDVGSRTDGRDTFFCLASHRNVANAENAGAIFGQKKVSKEKATPCRLDSALQRL
ncbi:hypothetical protein [Methylomonas sp. HYX-M1]|uniref:hypothetical protein n=1 Tax=Methylomonas sp. HYX-M1 TaxID=3139307 RepID=UPI00345C410C